jgi:hypothetical protein
MLVTGCTKHESSVNAAGDIHVTGLAEGSAVYRKKGTETIIASNANGAGVNAIVVSDAAIYAAAYQNEAS